MPFPENPLTYHGGCNCHAIRYRISLPSQSERDLSPYDPDVPTPEKPHLPLSMICHCNDCRRSTGQLISWALANSLSHISLSLRPTSIPAISVAEAGRLAADAATRDAADEARGTVKGAEWIPADRIFDRTKGVVALLTTESLSNETESENTAAAPTTSPSSGDAQLKISTYLTTYASSPKRTRIFCARCGTPLFYFVTWTEGLPEPWPTQLDVWAGSVDRCDLLDEAFRPVRELWCDFGIVWVGSIVGGEGTGVKRCGLWK